MNKYQKTIQMLKTQPIRYKGLTLEEAQYLAGKNLYPATAINTREPVIVCDGPKDKQMLNQILTKVSGIYPIVQ